MKIWAAMIIVVFVYIGMLLGHLIYYNWRTEIDRREWQEYIKQPWYISGNIGIGTTGVSYKVVHYGR